MSRLGQLIRRSVLVSVPGGGGSVDPTDPVDPTPSTYKLYSSPSTWVEGSTDPNDVPQDGDSFMIGVDSAIKMDASPTWGSVMVFGTLMIPNDMDISIDYHSIMFMPGSKLIFADGTPGSYLRNFTLRPRGTITGSTPRMVTPRTGQTAIQMGYFNNGSDRSIMFEDTAEVWGGPPVLDHHWRLADHAQQGTNFIKIRGTASVKQGDIFVIGTTDYYGQSGNSEMTVAADSTGDTITFTSNLPRFHWGKMQWVTKTADRVGHVSLVDEGWRPTSTAPYTFDMAAHVMRMNRPITVDGSQDGNLGGRVMVHGKSGRMEFDGWLTVDLGVKGHQQWYGGIHHHMPSYEMPDGPNAPSNGNYVGGSLDASLCSGHFVRNCAVLRSKNRGHVPHGANGVTYDHCVFYDVFSSSIFFEEGSARKCVVNECHSLKTRTPASADLLQFFDGADSANLGGTAAFWFTNPDNTLTNNSAGDCPTGFWNAFTQTNADMPGQFFGCFGLSKNIPFSPGRDLSILNWDNNECYSFRMKGILTDIPQSDEAGNVGFTEKSSADYPPQDVGDTKNPANKFTQRLHRPKLWKGYKGGYQNRVGKVEYVNPSIADIPGTGFNGATQANSAATDALAIAESLNFTTRPSGSPTKDAVAITYHGTLIFPGAVVVGYSYNGVAVDDEQITNGVGLLTSRGMFKGWSEYLYPESFWVSRSPGIELLSSDFMYRTPPQHVEQQAPYTPGPGRALNYDLLGDISGAIFMAYPYFGGAANQWSTYDVPFFSFGAANPVHLTFSDGQSNGLLTTTRFFGISEAPHARYDDISYPRPNPKGYIDYRRLNPSTLAEVDRWMSPGGNGSNTVRGVGFQHVAVANGGVYKLVTPDIPQNYWCASVLGARDKNDDWFVLCIPFTGSKTARVASNVSEYDLTQNGYYASTFAIADDSGRRFTEVTSGGSEANIIAGSANRFWQDKANNCVWLKFKGGLYYSYDNPANPYYIDHNDELYPQALMYLAVSAAP
jgi:hypothetical protein